MEVLIAAISIPVRDVTAPVLLAGTGGSSLLGGDVLLAPAVANALSLLGRGSVAVGISLASPGGVVVLSPLIIISADLTGVVLVVVRASSNGVVRLAPSGVVVRAVSLLGPLVIVVAAHGSTALPVGTVGGELLALALANGSIASVAGGTGEIAVLTPSLSAPLVIISVVPLVIRLSSVRFGGGLAVRLINGEILIAAPGIPVGGLLGLVLLSEASRGVVSSLGGLDDLGDGSVRDLSVASLGDLLAAKADTDTLAEADALVDTEADALADTEADALADTEADAVAEANTAVTTVSEGLGSLDSCNESSSESEFHFVKKKSLFNL